MNYLRKAIFPMILLIAAALSSCRNDTNEPDTPNGSDIAGYLQLAVTTDIITRANPTGGEMGDGLEHGRENENTIHNLMVFVYQQDADGLDGNKPVVWSKYVDSQTAQDGSIEYPIDRIYTVSIPLKEEDMVVFGISTQVALRTFIVANAGDLTETLKGYTVKDIANYINYGNAWTVANDGIPANSDYFVMSSAFNGVKRTDRYRTDGLIIPGERIYTSDVYLERVAARIDLEIGNNQYSQSGITYSNIGETNHYLSLTDIIPINLMQKNSFLLKSVSTGTTGNPQVMQRLIGGDETADNDGRPTNYVITPSFIDNRSYSLEGYFGNSRAKFLRDNINTIIADDNFKINKFGNPVDIPTDNWGNTTTNKAIVISYANENTVLERYQISAQTETDGNTTVINPSDYLTGLLFRAQYHPDKLYTSGQIGEGAPSKEYEDGNDFWLFRTVGANNTNIVEEKYNLYFASEEALKAYVANLPGGGKYETVYYPKGICYYNIWIKHANINNSDENFPMKYGIVRNNIYRIRLNFNGIGQPTPEITEPRNVNTRIYVIKWNFRPQPEIIM